MTINWNLRTYTKEEFISAWMEELSIAAIARRLGLVIYGSTYKTLRNTARELGLPDLERPGQGWSAGKKFTSRPAKSIHEYLTYGSNITSYHLKLKLFDAGVFEKKCYRQLPDGSICGLTEWHGESIPLHLDHIDGDNNNNCLANLRILCMNCHGQTPTYCKGQKKSRLEENNKKRKSRRVPLNSCADCDKEISTKAVRCKEHDLKRRKNKICVEPGCGEKTTGSRCRSHAALLQDTKITWPELDELIELIRGSNFSAVARELGVSDNAIRKHLRSRGISLSTLEPL